VWNDVRGRDAGVRLHLRFAFEESLLRLARLPWELLHDPWAPDFLLLDRRLLLLRVLERSEAMPPLQVILPMRIIIALAMPWGALPLDSARELERIREALPESDFEIEVMREATLEKLRDRLLPEDRTAPGKPLPAVLHFIGHGEVDSTGRQVSIFLQKDSGEPDRVDAAGLARAIRGTGVRLVLLNACHTGQLPENPAAGMAPTLLHSGIPAVIAMQHSVLDTDAIRFSESLYRRLAKEALLESAVCEARLALSQRSTVSWAVPALYLSVENGRLFQIKKEVSLPKQQGFKLVELTGPQAPVLLKLVRQERKQGEPRPIIIQEGEMTHSGVRLFSVVRIGETGDLGNGGLCLAQIDFSLHPLPERKDYRRLTVRFELPQGSLHDFYPKSRLAGEPLPGSLTFSPSQQLSPVPMDAEEPGPVSVAELRAAVTGYAEAVGSVYWILHPEEEDRPLLTGARSLLALLRIPPGVPRLQGTIQYEAEMTATLWEKVRRLGTARVSQPVAFQLDLSGGPPP
jgi:hypothetical protein